MLKESRVKQNGAVAPEDSRVREAVGERIDHPLPAFGREEDRRLGHQTSTAGVGGQTLGHQVLPRHSEVHRILNVNLAVRVALGRAAADCDLKQHTGTADTSRARCSRLCVSSGLVLYLELHDPALVGYDVVRDGVHLSAVCVAAHHHSIRRAAEALH